MGEKQEQLQVSPSSSIKDLRLIVDSLSSRQQRQMLALLEKKRDEGFQNDISWRNLSMEEIKKFRELWLRELHKCLFKVPEYECPEVFKQSKLMEEAFDELKSLWESADVNSEEYRIVLSWLRDAYENYYYKYDKDNYLDQLS